MKKLSLILSIISIQFGLAQEPIWTRSFRSGQDVLYEKSIYKTVEIAVENPIENTVEWKVWMLSDIQINQYPVFGNISICPGASLICIFVYLFSLIPF